MKFFNRNKQKNFSELGKQNKSELFMLVVKPYLANIFSKDIGKYGLERFKDELNKVNISTFYVTTNHGIYPLTKDDVHLLYMFPMLFVSESGRVGYILTMRLDIQTSINGLMNGLGFSSEHFLDYFGKYEAVIILNRSYKAMISFDNADVAIRVRQDGFSQEFDVANIIYCATVADSNTITNLQALASVAKQILSESKYKDNKNLATTDELPKLPDEMHSRWKKLFLDYFFDRAKELQK